MTEENAVKLYCVRYLYFLKINSTLLEVRHMRKYEQI
jgi:hypothetical protein